MHSHVLTLYSVPSAFGYANNLQCLKSKRYALNLNNEVGNLVPEFSKCKLNDTHLSNFYLVAILIGERVPRTMLPCFAPIISYTRHCTQEGYMSEQTTRSSGKLFEHERESPDRFR